MRSAPVGGVRRALPSISLIAALLAPACSSADSGPWLAALYLAGDSDLWQTAQYAASTARAATAGGMTSVVLLDGPPGPDSRATLTIRYGGRTSTRNWGSLNTGSPQSLARFTRYARSLRVAGPKALILLGHGKPPASVSDPWRLMTVAGGLGEDWSAGGDSLDAAEIEEALAGQSWDLVVLACCHGASVEQLWALRSAAKYAAAAPGEIATDGGELGRLVGALASRPTAEQAAATSASVLAAAAGDAGAMWMPAARLTGVAEHVRALGVEVRRDARNCARALEALRPLVPCWGPSGEMADLGALAAAMDAGVADPHVKSTAGTLAAEVSAAVHKTGGGGRPAGSFAPTNLGIFLPPLQTEPWKDYDKHAPFGRVTEWTLALAALHRAVAEDSSSAGVCLVSWAGLERKDLQPRSCCETSPEAP